MLHFSTAPSLTPARQDMTAEDVACEVTAGLTAAPDGPRAFPPCAHPPLLLYTDLWMWNGKLSKSRITGDLLHRTPPAQIGSLLDEVEGIAGARDTRSSILRRLSALKE